MDRSSPVGARCPLYLGYIPWRFNMNIRKLKYRLMIIRNNLFELKCDIYWKLGFKDHANNLRNEAYGINDEDHYPDYPFYG
jgi:hypothetical protein